MDEVMRGDDASALNGQLIYLDFDGAGAVRYNGPVQVNDIEVHAFRAPTELVGTESAVVSSITAALEDRFAPLGVAITTTEPTQASEAIESPDSIIAHEAGANSGPPTAAYSTIFIGGDDAAFRQYGSFLGIAEQVDTGNQDRSDNAFVFSEKIFLASMSAAGYVGALAKIIEHEALHLLGYAHADGETTGIHAVAAEGAVITVNSSADANLRDTVITLREAIMISNGDLDPESLEPSERAQLAGTPIEGNLDTIAFNISGDGVQTIFVGGGGLPFVTDPVVIDGTTQGGFDPDTHLPLIEINASGAGVDATGHIAAALEITGGGSTVKGLILNSAPGEGLRLRIKGGNTIVGNFIGTDAAGTGADVGNRNSGILILDSTGNQIGGADAGESNLISGNRGAGITIAGGGSTGNRVQGNLVGTDITGQKRLDNRLQGVLITALVGRVDYASNNLIGGIGVGEGNVISGNSDAGVAIVRGAGNKVQGNLIGTNSGGVGRLGNGRDGVQVIDAPDTQIGGTDLNAGNIISSNLSDGIAITGSGAVRTVVRGNLIGTDITGSLNFGNRSSGIFIGKHVEEPNVNPIAPPVTGAPSNTTIGGTTTAERNLISGNDQDGIRVEDGAKRTFVLGNFIGTNLSGSQRVRNAQDGVSIVESAETVVGAMLDAQGNLVQVGNLIAGNERNGVYITGSAARDNLVLGNIIGLQLTGNLPLANGTGVFIDSGAVGNTIGGTTFTERNVISGSALGVVIVGSGNSVQGNFIGTDASGTFAVGNTVGGVTVSGIENTIGGEQEDAFELKGGNLISGNAGFGVRIQSPGSGNTIKGNFIGTDKNGRPTVSNQQDGVLIDGARGNTIGGATLTPGFSPGNLISGNVRHGVFISGKDAKNNRVQGNVIGLDNVGLLGSNGGDGVRIEGGSDNTIGGNSEAVRNVISGNAQSGVHIRGADRNVVAGNFIGTDKTGTLDAGASTGNLEAGVSIVDGSGNVIGGEVVTAVGVNPRNIISGNLGFGVFISGLAAKGNFVRGNHIGVDPSGMLARPNGLDGVVITTLSSRNVIGGINPGERNIIGGNRGHGIRISDFARQNLVQGNFVGVGTDGIADLGNRQHGIFIERSNDNDIGQSPGAQAATAGNAIAFNGASLNRKGHGVVVASGSGNRISENSIFENAGRGIDLGNDSFTLNDVADDDFGANNLQDYPVVTGVQFLGASKLIHWSLDSTPNTRFRVEFFANTRSLLPDPSGFGEGDKFLKAVFVETDDQGYAAFSELFDASNRHIAATATDPFGNTSEFSMVDTDADALADAWETDLGSPGGIDIDEDGVVDVRLAGITNRVGLTVSPLRKDIFVEIDSMDSLAPLASALQRVEGAFASVPAILANNPLDATGIALHAVIDDIGIARFRFPLIEAQPGFWPEFDAVKRRFFGSVDEQGNPKLLAAKALAYRYALFADTIGNPAATGEFTNGIAELAVKDLGNNEFLGFGGNDLILATRAWGTPTEDEEAGTFMHELGHTLGLFHGGDQVELSGAFNFKPNYHSVMNYLWDDPKPWMPAGSWVLNYSDLKFSDLNENSLNEVLGIGGHVGHLVAAGPIIDGASRLVPELGPVDWNRDGDALDFAAVADLNNLNGSIGGQLSILRGFEDWSHLRFYFRELPNFSDGKHGRNFRSVGTVPETEGEETLDAQEQLESIGAGPGFFQLSRTNSFAFDEAGGFATIVVTRAGGTEGTVSVDVTTANGSALAGTDYTATSGTLTFASGEYSKSIAIPISNDLLFEPTKTFHIALSQPTGGATLGQRIEADVSILDDDGQGVFQFDEPAFLVRENDLAATITVTRTGGTNGAASVAFTTVNALATAGQDYVAKSGTLNFAAGESSKVFTIAILDDAVVEGIEDVRLVLSAPSAGTALGELRESSLIIQDVERGTFQFSAAIYETGEGAALATMTVTRVNGADGNVTVDFATSNATAAADSDYASTSGTLTFLDGETVKSFTVSILDDDIAELTETVNLTLSNPTGGALLGAGKTAELRIADDEPAALVFSAPSFDVNENASTATIQVIRLGTIDEPIAVEFKTADGTARAGIDYLASAGTIFLVGGETSQTFTISVIDDKLGEGTKTLELRLLDPNVGAPATATLRILDDETANAATFVVTNTNDSGAGSLRQAILNANARAGTDFITFNIPGAGVKTIRPLSALPTITSPVTIDGYSQPGASANTLTSGDNAVLLIELDGSTPIASEGVLFIQAGNSVVRGLVINRLATAGITMNSGGGNLIAGNFIGTDVTGMIGLGSNTTAIKIGSTNILGGFSSNNTIGGVAPEMRNVVSSIAIFSDARVADKSRGNQILGNHIGVAADATTALGNFGGIRIQTDDRGGAGIVPGNIIGGIEPGAGNLIAFSADGGVNVTSGYGNSIRGNSIHANDPAPPQSAGNFRSLGITLGDASALSSLTINDSQDTDTGDKLLRFSNTQAVTLPGGNRSQNYPVLSSAIAENGTITVQGRLDSAPITAFQIDFYANKQMDPTGFGEGRFYLGTVAVTTDTTGHVDFSEVFDLTTPDIRFITATATDPGNNTSEFSARVTVGEVLGDVYVVNTTDDHDDGVADAQDTTLREAIHAANNHPGTDLIKFNIPGSGVRRITLNSALPPIMDPVTIDGYTQPGARPNTKDLGFDGVLLIELTSTTIPSGLILSGGNSTVRGLIINGFPTSLVVVGGGNNVIEGNFVGIDATGTSNASFNGSSFGGSIVVRNSSNNLIGGVLPEARNLLSIVQLNAGADDNRVQGNYIGLRASGLSRLNGAGVGNLFIDRSSNNLIGGSAPGEGNVLYGSLSISGAPFFDGAVDLSGFTTARANRVLGNLIGVGADRVTPLGFTGAGVTIAGGASGNTIGGIEPGEGNIIARNDIGLRVVSGGDFATGLPIHPTSNAIRGNSIYLNTALGIDLEGDIFTSFVSTGRDVTRNDNTDLAVGPNHLQNFPVLSSALSANGVTVIEGRLTSTPNRVFMIDLYANEQMDLSGYGEGQTYIGTAKANTDAAGRANFSVTLPLAIPNGRFITATATNPDNETSEFSARIEAGDVLGSVFVVNKTDDHDDGVADATDTTLREAIHAANNHPGHDLILFNIPGEGLKTIATLSSLPPITDEVTVDGYSQPGASPNTLAEGNNAVLLVQLIDGNPQGFSGAHIGVEIRAGNSTVRGLVINRFSSGAIFITENGGNTIAGNFLGTDSSGTTALNSGSLSIFSSSDNTIGGATPEARNVIIGSVQIIGGDGPAIIPNEAAFYAASGNHIQGNYIGLDKNGSAVLGSGSAVHLAGTFDNLIGGTTPGARNVIVGTVSLGANGFAGVAAGNMVQGNYIGTDRTGRVALGGGGVQLGGMGNIVGGTAAGAGNLISGTNSFGILTGGFSTLASVSGNHIIQGNRIGTDVDGTSALGNRNDGIFISESGNLIGGSEPGAGNIISGNGGSGIQLTGFVTFTGSVQINHPATGNTIQGNWIGTQADGVSPLPNLGDGILVSPSIGNVPVIGAMDSLIGGSASGAGNVIAFNGGNGINLNGGTAGNGIAGSQIAIASNSIYSNGKLGIDLKGNGPTPNDTSDFDFGDNSLQNFPVLTSISNTGNNITISGTLNSLPNSTYRLEFFDNIAFDNSGFGEGARFIGATSVATDANGSANFTVTFQVAVPLTHIITSTATDSQGNTSEFSGRQPNGNFGETANLSVSLSDAPDPIFDRQLLAYTITVINNGPNTATNIVLTDTLPNGVTLQPGTQGVLGLLGSNTVLATIASLARGTSAAVEIRVVPTNTGVLTNSVKVTSDQFDPDSANNSASTTTTVNPLADLSVTMSSDAAGPVGVGSQVSFTITVTNRGPSPATAVRLTDTLPQSLAFSFFNSPAGSHSAGTITWDLGTLFPGQSTTRTFFATANATGTVTNSVQVASSTADIETANNAANVEIAIVPSADVKVTLSAAPALVDVGDLVTYTLTVVNNGPSTAASVVLTDTLPAAVSVDSVSASQGDFVVANGTVAFDLGDLAGGATATATIVVIPSRTGVILSNAIEVAAATLDSNPNNNRATASTPVLSAGGTAPLFGAAQIGGGPTSLYAIDALTGSAALIGAIGFDRVSAMDFHPRTGVLYGVGERPGTNTRILITIDPLSGIGTEVGLTQVSAINDASFRNNDAVLFGYLGNTEELATINLSTGLASVVGDVSVSGGSGNGLAFAPNGVLYHADDEDLNSIDPATGSVTALHDLGFSPPADSFPRINAMDFDPKTGLLFGSLNDSFRNQIENYLSVLDIATGVVTIIGRTVDGLDAIAFAFPDEGENSAPVLALIGDQVVEEGAVRIVTVSATDDDGDPVSFSASGLPGFASFIDNGDRTATLRLNPGFDDTGLYAGIVIRASDGTASDEETFAVTVSNTNRTSVAADDSAETDEDETVVIDVLANDTDPDGDSLTAAIVGGPAHGAVIKNPDGTFNYTPALDYFGPDSFTYRLNDGTVDSNTATVSITILPINDAPVALNDAFSIAEDTALIIDPRTNDTDADGDALELVVIDGPQHGVMTTNADGTATFTPAENFHGEDSFAYRLNDGATDSELASVTITVTPLNDAPIAFDDAAEVGSGETIGIDVVVNDTDVDGDALTPIIIAEPAHGQVVVNADGSIAYTASGAFAGVDMFTYSANDGTTSSAPATVRVTVRTEENQAPVAVDDEFDVDEDGLVTFDVRVNDSDANNDALGVEVVTGPIHGTLAANADGSLTYTPAPDFNGADRFIYRASDGLLESNTATVQITVGAVNDAPVADDDSYAMFEGQTLNAAAAEGLLIGDIDLDNDALTVAFFTDPAHGVLAVADDGSFSYTPQTGFQDTDAFSYRVTDGLGGEAIGHVTIDVLAFGPLRVIAFDPDCNDFHVRFNDTFDPALVNLYVNAADVIVRGAATGLIAGSLIQDADGRGFTFLKSGTAFTADIYTVTLKSGSSAFTNVRRGDLDGDGDGVAGGDYVTTFTLVLPSAIKVGLPDFMRGPGQEVHVPAAAFQDLPLTLTSAGEVSRATLEIRTNPAHLEITGAHAGAGLPAGSSFTVDLTQPGVARIELSTPTETYFPAGTFTMLALEAHVPLDATYKARHYIDVGAVEINGQLVECADDDAFHLVGYLGDANANASYQLEDVQLIQRIAVRATNGFAAWADINPLLVADIDNNRFITSTDATRVNQEMSGVDRLEIPPLPDRTLPDPEPLPSGALKVTRFTAMPSGFDLSFDRAIDTGTVNLYAVAGATADMEVRGALSGLVNGTVVFERAASGLSFVKTGGTLNPDTYTVRLRSAAEAFKGTDGTLLDGDADGVEGDDYQSSFIVAVPLGSAGTVSIGEFARGAGQPIDVPATAAGLPITLTSNGAIQTLSFALDFDARLLDLARASVAQGLPAGTVLQQVITAGRAEVTLIAPTAISAGTLKLLTLDAEVPASAPYGAKQVLDLQNVLLNAQAGVDDDGVHVAAYFGDASGSADYTTLDVQRLQRVITRTDAAFEAYANVDPSVVGDISGNGELSPLDATRLLQEVSYLMGEAATDRPEIPELPAHLTPVRLSGPDPMLTIPRHLTAEPGGVITVPIRLDPGLGLESVQLTLGYDPAALQVTDIRRGSLTQGFEWYLRSVTEGGLRVDLSGFDAVTQASGTVLEFDVRVREQAPEVIALDLQQGSLNDGRLSLNVKPRVGEDATDGRITVERAPPSAASVAKPGLLTRLFSALRQVVGAGAGIEAAGVSTPYSLYPLSVAAALIAPEARDTVQTLSAPRIDLGAQPLTRVAFSASPANAGWKRVFVNETFATKNPNSAIKVTLPATSKVNATQNLRT